MKHLIRLIPASLMLLLTLPVSSFASKTHVVTRPTETLQSIARKYRISVNELKSVNNLSSSRLPKGTSIIIPTQSAQAEKQVENCSNYKVVKGDTLPSIAKKTGVKMATLRKLNAIRGNKVKPGQLLALTATTGVVCDIATRRQSTSERLRLVNKDLLNEQEINEVMAELSDVDTDAPVDLAKNLEDKRTYASLQKNAYSFLGAHYRFGGNSPYSLDCSSFTQQVFRKQDVKLPRTAREQFSVGMEVPRGDLKRGDLVFFRTYASYASHVGIYLGNRKMIHASSRDRKVVISSMDTPYYISRFLGARRIGKIDPEGLDLSKLLLGVEEESGMDALSNDHLGISLPEAINN